MPYGQFDIAEAVRYSIYLTAAFVTGMLGYIFRQLDAKERPLLWRVLLEGFGAIVVGLILVQLCDLMKLGPQWTTIIVALGGWMGAQSTIRILEAYVLKRLNVKDPRKDDKSQNSGDAE